MAFGRRLGNEVLPAALASSASSLASSKSSPSPRHLVSQRLVVATQPGGLAAGLSVLTRELAKRRGQSVTLKLEGCNGSSQPGAVGFIERCLESPFSP